MLAPYVRAVQPALAVKGARMTTAGLLLFSFFFFLNICQSVGQSDQLMESI